jgi:hypothetical protein
MRVIVTKIYGDASLTFHNKQGDIIHVEGFSGYISGKHGPDNGYIRKVPVAECEYSYTTALFDKDFEYLVTHD